MRILIATRHMAIVGGVETYLQAVLPQLVAVHELGVLAEVTATGGILAACPDVPVWYASGPTRAAVLEEIRRWRPDVVYCHGLEDPDLESTLVQSFATVMFAHNYHGTCISGSKSHTWPAFRPCERRLSPGCLLAYLPCGCGGLNPLTMVRLYRGQRRRQALLADYRAVLVASRHMREEYRRHGVADERLHLLPLFPAGIDPDPNPPGFRTPKGRILLLGRLTNLKGGGFLIEALRLARKRLPGDLTLIVLGDGPEREALQRCCAEAGLSAEFRGWVDASTRTELMRTGDLLAVPSVWPEPFGLVGIEAGCVGLPAVGFAVGGIPDWLCPGVSGELASGVRPGAPDLADAIVRALADVDYWNRLRVGAWQMARRFTLHAHLEKLQAVLDDAVRPGPAAVGRGAVAVP
jgi:glycosyltransferase involved in cell wall biosynthesis